MTGPGGAPTDRPFLRTGTEADAPTVARLHAEGIADGFLSFLGPGFLIPLYRRICRSEHSFLIVADDGGTVIGFIAGCADVRRLYRSFLLHDGVRAALVSAGRVVTGWRRVLETLRHGSGQQVGTGRGTELLAVAVDSTHRGSGIGAVLVDRFLDEVVRRGGRVAFVVVAADNVGAIGLYRRAGFTTGEEFELHAGSTSLLMQWDRDPTGLDGRAAP
ncbi:MAG: N-acetyltransferase family protein [Acidimicrobiales bacterium]